MTCPGQTGKLQLGWGKGCRKGKSDQDKKLQEKRIAMKCLMVCANSVHLTVARVTVPWGEGRRALLCAGNLKL
jgi:hypothetical protein